MTSTWRHLRLLSRWLCAIPERRLSRLLNFLAVYWATRRKPECLPCHPYAVQIEPTVLCNYDCPDCGGRQRCAASRGGMMDVDAYLAFIASLRGRAWLLDFTGQGESFLHPGIYTMIRAAVDAGFYTRVETNGSCLDLAAVETCGLHHIHLAVDGMTPASYSAYRRQGNFEVVCRNIEALAALRRKTGRPHIEVRFLVFRHNEEEIEIAAHYFRGLGIPCCFAAPYLPHGFEKADTYAKRQRLEISAASFARWSSTKPDYVIYEKDAASGNYRHLALKNEFSGRCTAPWGGLNIRWNGEAIPCCHMLNEEASFGNVFEQGFADVWNGAAFRDFRRRAAADFSRLSLCAVCPMNYGASGRR